MLRKWILNFDSLSTRPIFYYRSQERYHTFTGVCLTVTQIFFIAFFSVYLLIEFMNTDKFFLRTSKETSFTAKLDFKNKMIFYKLIDSFNNELDPRIAVTVPTYWKITENLTDVTILNSTKCSESKTANYKNKVKFDISNFTCFDLEEQNDLILEVSKDYYYSSYLNIYIAGCQNTSENHNHCFTPEHIQQELRKTSNFASFYMESNILNHLNVTEPIVFSYYTEQIPLSVDLLLIRYLDYRYLLYESDNGYLFESKHYHQSFYLDPFLQRNEILLGGERVWFPDTLQILRIRLDGNYAEKHNRSYSKIQTLIANIGGITNAINVIMNIIGCSLSKGLFFVDFANKDCEVNSAYYNSSNPKLKTIHLTNSNINQSQFILTDFIPKLKTSLKNVVLPNNIYWWDSIIFYLRLYKNKNVSYMTKCESYARRVLSVDSIIRITNRVDAWLEWKSNQDQLGLKIGDSNIIEANKKGKTNINVRKESINIEDR